MKKESKKGETHKDLQAKNSKSRNARMWIADFGMQISVRKTGHIESATSWLEPVTEVDRCSWKCCDLA